MNNLNWHDEDIPYSNPYRGMYLNDQRAVRASGVMDLVEEIGSGTQSTAYRATDRDGEQVCLKLTTVYGNGFAYHGNWIRSWGKRWFDCPIIRTGFIRIRKGSYTRWVIQPLGEPLKEFTDDESEFEDFREDIELRGAYWMDGGCWQCVRLPDGKIVLVDYASVLDPDTDLRKHERDTYERFQVLHDCITEQRRSVGKYKDAFAVTEQTVNAHTGEEVLISCIYRYHCAMMDNPFDD